MDNDDAGEKAISAAIEGLRHMEFSGSVEIYSPPACKDWNEYIVSTSDGKDGVKAIKEDPFQNREEPAAKGWKPRSEKDEDLNYPEAVDR